MAPLVTANVREPDVMRFWLKQPFDLGLKPGQGNCDLCFLKGKGTLKALIRAEPERAEWWSRIERTIGKGTFRSDCSYAGLVRDVAASPLLPLEDGDDDEFDAECGLWCGGEAA